MSDHRTTGLRLGRIDTDLPVIQGGMGVGISLSGLATAVAEAGGVGVLSAAGIGMIDPDYRSDFRQANQRALRAEIRRVREATSGALGVNIMMALTDSGALIATAIEENVDVILLGAGLPLKPPKEVPADVLTKTETAFVPIVSSGRAARLILKHWSRHYDRLPDGFVVEGPLAGGHLGFKREQIDSEEYTLEHLLRGVLDAVGEFTEPGDVGLPVFAAGGVYDAADVRRMLDLGATGVQMATRFVATEECDAAPEFKQAYLGCTPADLTIIDSPLGLPGRAIGNAFLGSVAAGERRPTQCAWHCLRTCDPDRSPYCIAHALMSAKRGNLESGFAFAGANVHRVNEIVPVAELMAELAQGFHRSEGAVA